MVSVTALGWRLVSVWEWEWEFELVSELAMVSVTALE
jgi:hypothetical protein